MNVFKKQKIKGQTIFKVVQPGSFGKRPEYVQERLPEYAPFYSYGRNPKLEEEVIIVGGEGMIKGISCVIVQSISTDNVYIMPKQYIKEVEVR